MNEVVIRGGTLIDGTGAAARRADVGLSGGLISELGTNVAGERVIDASGLVVAPGFIDVHTHYDAQVLWDPWLTPSSCQGVTTVIAGNCGFSLAPCAPAQRGLIARTLERVEAMTLEALTAGIAWDFETFGDYLAAVRRRRPVLNYGQFLGHTAIRLFVMGDAAYEREATQQEIAQMCQVLSQGLNAGAIGFSTTLSRAHQGDGGRPVPSRFAAQAEIWALVQVLTDSGRGVLQIVPGESVVSFENVFATAASVRQPIVFSEVLTRDDGEHWARLRALTHARESGAGNLWGLMAVHPIVFQYLLTDPFPFNQLAEVAALHAEPPGVRITRYGDAAWRAAIQAQIDEADLGRWERTFFAETRREDLIGRSVADVSAEWGIGPLEAMITVGLDEGLDTRFRVELVNNDQNSIEKLLQADGLLVGLSDAGAHATQLCDAPVAARLLSTFVRERLAISLEEAIWKLTGQPAGIFGIVGRGVIKPGMSADVTVFDPGTIAPGPIRRVWDFPGGTDRLTMDHPEGIIHVLVNGTPIWRDGERAEVTPDRRPGLVLTGAAAGAGGGR